MDNKKGFALLTALLMVLFVALAMAVIGTAFLKSTQIGHGIKVFKTTKEAAETTAYATTKDIDNGVVSEKVQNCPSIRKGNCTIYTDCDITPDKIESSVNASSSSSSIKEVNAYLISDCLEGSSHIYTIVVNATAKNGATTTIYFIYEK